MLRWLRSPHLTWRPGRLLNFVLLVVLAASLAPAQADALAPPAAQQQPAAQSAPQTLNFVNNVAQVQATVSLNQNQIYLFFGTQGQQLQINLSSTPAGANFELRGANNVVYKTFGDPSLNWSFTLPESQNYRITVNSATPVTFTMVVTLGAWNPTALPTFLPTPPPGQPLRITFAPGQTSLQVSGVAAPGQSPEYIFAGNAGQSLRLSISSNNGQANFTVRGRSDNILYKGPGDLRTDWEMVLPATQDYLVTMTSSWATTNFVLNIFLSGSGQPQRITFMPGQTLVEVSGTAAPWQSPQYIFTGSTGQTLRVVLFSTNGQANFSLRGVLNNQILKADTDPSRNWQTVLTANQDYLITVISPQQQTNFTLQIFLSGTPSPTQPERIDFPPGQNSAVRSGNLQFNVPKDYVVNVANPGTMRVLLTAQPAGSSNFSVVGVSDRVIYKQITDPAREWSYPITVAQDYVISIVPSSSPSSYILEVSVPQAPTPTPGTPVPTPPPDCTTDTIQNGGFEVDGFWIFGDSPVQPAYVSNVVRTPLRSMRLGIDPAMGAGIQNQKAFSSIRQPFQIPMTASIAQLRWWNFYRTEETQTDTPGIAEDKQQVVLLNPDLTTVAVLRSVRRNTGAWQEEMVDLTPYRGRPLLLYFNVYNDGNGLRTWQFLDDVRVYACFPAVTATPFVPTPIPTMYPTIIMPTVIVPTFVVPTILVPTIVAPTSAPTWIVPTVVGPPVVAPTDILTGALPGPAITPQPGGAVGDAFLMQTPVNGEPEVIQLPPDLSTATAGMQIAVAPEFAAAPTATPTPRPVVELWSPRLFDRPLDEVLTWSGIMLGALAIIGILVALIWQAASNRPRP